MKTLTTLLIIGITLIALPTKAQLVACRGINDSIEIKGGTAPYTWLVDSISYDYSTNGTCIIMGCNAIGCAPTTTFTQIIFATGTVALPKKFLPTCTNAWYTSQYPNQGNGFPIKIVDANGDSLIINSAAELQYPTTTITSINESAAAYCDGSIAATLIGTNVQTIWSTGSTNDSISGLCAGDYTLNLIDSAGCKNSYIATIAPGVAPIGQSICLITVDQTNTHNLLVWDKTNLEPTIDSIIIYRKIGTPYVRVGAVHKDSLSAFDDYLANPNVTGYRYKLTSKNAAGVESDLSAYHNTIYLTNNGANFNWTPYQVENVTEPVASYNLWRDDNSTGDFQIIVTTDGTQTGFTDINFSSFPNASYYVEAVMVTGDCNPTRTFTGARSNKKVFTTTGIKEVKNSSLNVYPNPATDLINISGVENGSVITMYDAVGRVVMNVKANGNTTLDISSIETGIYTLVTTTENSRAVNKIVKN